MNLVLMRTYIELVHNENLHITCVILGTYIELVYNENLYTTCV